MFDSTILETNVASFQGIVRLAWCAGLLCPNGETDFGSFHSQTDRVADMFHRKLDEAEGLIKTVDRRTYSVA